MAFVVVRIIIIGPSTIKEDTDGSVFPNPIADLVRIDPQGQLVGEDISEGRGVNSTRLPCFGEDGV